MLDEIIIPEERELMLIDEAEMKYPDGGIYFAYSKNPPRREGLDEYTDNRLGFVIVAFPFVMTREESAKVRDIVDKYPSPDYDVILTEGYNCWNYRIFTLEDRKRKD